MNNKSRTINHFYNPFRPLPSVLCPGIRTQKYLFMQNKPNFPRFYAKNNDYDKKQTQFKPNSNPIQTQFKPKKWRAFWPADITFFRQNSNQWFL